MTHMRLYNTDLLTSGLSDTESFLLLLLMRGTIGGGLIDRLAVSYPPECQSDAGVVETVEHKHCHTLQSESEIC